MDTPFTVFIAATGQRLSLSTSPSPADNALWQMVGQASVATVRLFLQNHDYSRSALDAAVGIAALRPHKPSLPLLKLLLRHVPDYWDEEVLKNEQWGTLCASRISGRSGVAMGGQENAGRKRCAGQILRLHTQREQSLFFYCTATRPSGNHIRRFPCLARVVGSSLLIVCFCCLASCVSSHCFCGGSIYRKLSPCTACGHTSNMRNTIFLVPGLSNARAQTSATSSGRIIRTNGSM